MLGYTEVEKVVHPVILDDRKYFWNGVLAKNILVSWGNCCVNGQNLNNIDLCCLNLFQKMTNYTFCFNEYRYKMCWKGEISQKIFCLWMRMTERKIFFPPLLIWPTKLGFRVWHSQLSLYLNCYEVQILEVAGALTHDSFMTISFSSRGRSSRTAPNCLTEILGCLRQLSPS